MKTVVVYFLITFGLLTIQTNLFGQEEKQSGKKLLKYDDWPTIKSNANIKDHIMNKSDGITPNFVLIGRQWDIRIITYFFQNGTPDIAGNNEQNAIRAAMDIWSNATDMFFIEVCTQAEADISFLFGAGNHGDPIPACEPGLGAFDGQGGTLAHNMGGPDPDNNCGAQGADVHFDESEDWVDAIRANGDQPIDLVTVAAHELGHALGLFHTTVSGSLMLSNYTESHRFLGSDDIAGIRSLYGFPQANTPITDPELICTGETFALQEQPAGTTVNWSSSNPDGLSINDTTGVATRQNNFDGKVTVTATIDSGCGTVNIARNVWVGRPFIDYVTFANCDNEGGYFCTSCYGNTIEVASETPNATFEARLLSFPSLTVVYTSPTIYSSDVPGIFNYIPIPNNGYYLLELRGTNECGTTDWFGNEVEYVDCSLFRVAKQFTAYPVPFKDELNINLVTKTGSKNELSGKNETTKEIYLVDFKTSAVVYRTTVSDNNHVIDTKQIAPGQYVLMVKGSVTESLLVMKK